MASPTSGQNAEWAQLETQLVSQYRECMEADSDSRFDSLGPLLKSKLHSVFTTKGNFEHGFDSLSQHISLIDSNDGKVRIVSYDERTGGSRHEMAALLLVNDQGTINGYWIDNDIGESPEDEPSGVTDEIIYKLIEIEIDQTTYYLCFGWGTYGGGHHHNSILVFRLEEDQVIWTPELIPESYHKIFAARRDQVELEFDSVKQTIHFNEFKRQDDVDLFVVPTGKKIFLELVDGKFLERSDQ